MSTTTDIATIESRKSTGAERPPYGGKIKLSATRFKTYLMCPRQFRYRYVDQLPTAFTGALAFGKVIHQVIHDLHQWSIYSNEPLHEQVALSNFAGLWDQTVSEQHPVFKCDDEIAEYTQLAQLILMGYVEAQKEKPTPFLLEFPFELEMHDEHYGHDYVLAGVIDRIDQEEDGLVIVDFKTAKRKPSLRDLASDVQLSVYAFAAEEIFGQKVEQVILYHLRDQTALSTKRSPQQIHQLTDCLMPHVVRGIAEMNFSPRIGYWCNFCEFKRQCLAEGPESAL